MKFTKRGIFFAFLLLALGTALFIYGGVQFGSILIKPDESLYTEISLSMKAHHDFLIPFLHGQPNFVKPPLVYWMEIAGFKLFGQSLWAAQLPVWILGIIALFLTHGIGKELFSPKVGFTASALLLSCVVFFQYSQADMMDLPLTFSLLLCLYSFIRGAKSNPTWFLLSGAGAGLLFLTKGPIGDLLAILLLIEYSLVYRCWDRLRRMETAGGILLALFSVLLWPALIAGKGYFQDWWADFILGENFGKFAGPVMPTAILLIGLLGGIAPWTFLFLESFVKSFRNIKLHPAKIFLLLWLSSFFLVFILPARKLPHYVIPTFPAVCLLTASTESFSLLTIWLTRILLAFLGIGWIAGARLTDLVALQTLCLLGGTASLAGSLLLRNARQLTIAATAFSLLLFTLPVVMPGIQQRNQMEMISKLPPQKTVGVFCPNDYDLRGYEISPEFASCETRETAETLLKNGGILIFPERERSRLKSAPLQILSSWTVWKTGIGLGNVIHVIMTGNPDEVLEPMDAASQSQIRDTSGDAPDISG